jgi:2-polyprenyl-3-methyl-5-hydroxy-6-metoxy-1,4-benzoquinol methylase
MDLIEYKKVSKQTFNRHPWELARLKVLKFVLQKFNKGKTIADIGSGDAFFSKTIAKENTDFNLLTIDSNYTQELIDELYKETGNNILFLKNLNDIQSKHSNSISFVLLMDVVEHVENPKEVFQKIFESAGISASAIFLITVPAYQFLFSEHDKNLGHYRRYNRSQLKKELKLSGFTIIKSGYFFNSLLIPRFFQKIIEQAGLKKGFGQNELHSWNKGKMLTNLLTNLFWIEFKISWYLSGAGINVPGLTCYCICKHCP